MFFEIRDLYGTMWLKCCRGTQTTNDDITWRMSIECLIPKATNTHSEYATLIVFHCNNCCTKAPQCYVMPTLPNLL